MKRGGKGPRPTTTGVLVVDKPVGPTSMDVVSLVRRRAGGAKTGHAGTLDPLASGVLVLALGRATKAIDTIMATSKRYETVVNLSCFMTTDDLEGEPIETVIEREPSAAEIDAALADFRGDYWQEPPAHSAIKIGGQPAYKLARAGKAPKLEARRIVVHELSVLRYDWPEVALDVWCEKGLYVRRLARDLGEAPGTGGHCTAIRRTAVGPFDLAEAIGMNDVPEPLTEDDLIPVDEALRRVREAASDAGCTGI